jgi:NAD(P)H dehydrogenase (quinone)
MRCLIVVAHPLECGLSRRFADLARRQLEKGGNDVTLIDLYGEGFEPSLSPAERSSYYADAYHGVAVARHAEALRSADMLVLAFPTWWFGMPAILKGWIDRVFSPAVAFDHGKDFGPIVPLLTNLKRAVVTTLGTPWWLDRLVMWRPVRRILKTAVLGACAPNAKLDYLVLYAAEAPSPARIDTFEKRIVRSLAR